MAFLHNIAANRELREGDLVRVVAGPRAGSEGTVVGFAMYSPRPVVVQYDGPSGLLRETFAANEVEIRTCVEAPENLEPLPDIRRILGDSKEGELARCGDGVAVVCEGGAYTLLPLVPSSDFVRICETETHHSLEEKVSALLHLCFVTRLPHLVRTVRRT